jgi:Tfp pilus assembly protein PilV
MSAPFKDQSGRSTDEAGISLIELIIASALSLLVLSLIAGLFLSTYHAQNSIRTATQAAALGQLIARSVDQGVSNATALKVQTDSATGAQLMLARTYGMDPSVDPTQAAAAGSSCLAWFYSPASGGAIYTKRTTPAVAIAMPTTTPDSSWTLLGNGLEVQVGAAPSALIFSTPDGTRVDLKFDVLNGSDNPVHIETTATIPNPTTESAPCF